MSNVRLPVISYRCPVHYDHATFIGPRCCALAVATMTGQFEDTTHTDMLDPLALDTVATAFVARKIEAMAADDVGLADRIAPEDQDRAMTPAELAACAAIVTACYLPTMHMKIATRELRGAHTTREARVAMIAIQTAFDELTTNLAGLSL